MYTKKVMDHFSNPRNMGEIENGGWNRHRWECKMR